MTADFKRALIALAVLVVAVVAYVILTVTGNDAGPLLGWLGPIVSGVWAVTEVRSVKRVQGEVLARIDHNVNGALDARIQDAVRNALDAHAVQDARIRALAEQQRQTGGG